jgi:hypothetical protein
VKDIDHRDICSAVRAWAAAEGRVVVALQIQEAAEELQLDGVDFSGRADVWNVKLFRWLDNKEDSAFTERTSNSWCPRSCLYYRFDTATRVVKNDCLPTAWPGWKRVSEAKQALMLDAPKKEKLKELGEGIFEMFRIDPDLTAPLLAMVTTMLGAM